MIKYKRLDTDPEEVRRENLIAEKIAKVWGFDEKRMGDYSSLDRYMLKDNFLAAVVEIRSLYQPFGKYPDFFIDIDKWFILMLAETGLGLPGIYVIAFTDGIYAVRVGDVPVRDFPIKYTGRPNRPWRPNEMSPAIKMPRHLMDKVCDANDVFPPGGLVDLAAEPPPGF